MDPSFHNRGNLFVHLAAHKFLLTFKIKWLNLRTSIRAES
jgi:hypothetical protein